MSQLSHSEIWAAIDRLAVQAGTSPSGLAKLAGLDPTIFNRSKRQSGASPERQRWPSTESLARILEATEVSLAEFAALAQPVKGRRKRQQIPLIGLAQAGNDGFFDDAGFPKGQGWEAVDLPGPDQEGLYALEISGESMLPVYRDGDRIIVDPFAEPRRGDRVVVKTRAGEVLAKELQRLTSTHVELSSLNPAFEPRRIERSELAWIARILWASQ
jgi:phage repressor protein C with HTH and peptisase S24 domain